jgi:hypothetical protein
VLQWRWPDNQPEAFGQHVFFGSFLDKQKGTIIKRCLCKGKHHCKHQLQTLIMPKVTDKKIEPKRELLPLKKQKQLSYSQRTL